MVVAADIAVDHLSIAIVFLPPELHEAKQVISDRATFNIRKELVLRQIKHILQKIQIH